MRAQMHATPALAEVTTFESQGRTVASLDLGTPYYDGGVLETGITFLFPAEALRDVAKLLRAAADEAERLAPSEAAA